MDYVIRPLTPTDEPLLWDMLYQGLRPAEVDDGASPDLVRHPDIARYVEGWGRAGDAGFVAHDTQDGSPLGAVWLRRSADEKETVAPELACAVRPGQRRRGIGAALLTQWIKANPQESCISLAVVAGHPAVRLFERFGFKVVAEAPGTVTLRREI